MKKIGAEQILLDIQAVKSCLLDLPGGQTESAATRYVHRARSAPLFTVCFSYNKYVTKNTGQLETMLKVILAPDVRNALCDSDELTTSLQDPPEGFVQNYCLLIGDRSFSNFQKVCTLPDAALTLRSWT